jgi:hypothetical protein
VKSVVTSGGLAVTFTGVTQASIDMKGNLVMFSGDGDRFPTTKVNDFADPTITIQSADLTAIRSCLPGSACTLTVTIYDAKNVAGGVGSGELTVVLSNAIVSNNPITQQHRQFGSGSVEFQSWSSDGVTSPLATTFA